MLRKLCRHTGTQYIRSFFSKDVRFRSAQCNFLLSTFRLISCPERQEFLKFKSNNRNFSEHPPSFKDKNDFEVKCSDTLDSLADYFEDLVENDDHLDKADVNYSDGVLTVQFGEPYGTYVINRQSPNFQIWLSSPSSGPKRYDFANDVWVYTHDGVSLHDLLNKEVSKITKRPVNFSDCSYGRRPNEV